MNDRNDSPRPNDPLPVSDLLRNVQSFEPANSELLDYYKNRLVPYAQRFISEAIAAQISRDDILNSTIKSALSEVRHGRCRVEHRTDFEKLLWKVFRNKVRDAWKYVKAQKRSHEREAGMLPDVPAHPALSPADKAEMDKAIMLITEDFACEPEPVLRIIYLLGIVRGFSARAVADFLKRERPVAEHYCPNTIRKIVKQKCDDLARRFGFSPRDEETDEE